MKTTATAPRDLPKTAEQVQNAQISSEVSGCAAAFKQQLTSRILHVTPNAIFLQPCRSTGHIAALKQP